MELEKQVKQNLFVAKQASEADFQQKVKKFTRCIERHMPNTEELSKIILDESKMGETQWTQSVYSCFFSKWNVWNSSPCHIWKTELIKKIKDQISLPELDVRLEYCAPPGTFYDYIVLQLDWSKCV